MPLDDSDGHDTDELDERRWLRDPYLLALSLLRWVLNAFGSVYEWFEDLPGKIRFLSGVGFFLFSIYFGDALKTLLDRIAESTVTPVMGNISGFPFSTQVVLLLLVILSVQSSLINHRSSRINYGLIILESKVEQRMRTAEEPVTDGGQHYSPGSPDHDAESSRAGALGGAAAGAAFGAVFGPGGVLGGAILGAIVGDEVEKSSARSRKKKELKVKMIRRLQRHPFQSQPFHIESILEWFPRDESGRVRSLVDEMCTDPDAPVEKTHDGRVYLTSPEETEAYLKELSGSRSENW